MVGSGNGMGEAAGAAGAIDIGTSLLEIAPLAVVILTPDGTVQHLSTFLEHLSGWRVEEVRGLDWFSTFVREQDRERFRAEFQAALQDQPARGAVRPILTRGGELRVVKWNEKVHRGPDGRVIGVLAAGVDVTGHAGTLQEQARTEPSFGESPGVLAEAVDITDRKRAELSLWHSEEKFRALFEWSPLAVALASVDGVVTDVNHAFTAQFGRSRDRVIGRTPAWLWVNLDDRRRVVELLQRRGSIEGIEAQLRRADGEILTGLLSGRTVRIGEQTFHLLSMVDITDRKRTERALNLLSTETAHLSGKSFFEIIARQLQSVLDVEIAFVGTLLGPAGARLRTIGLAIDGPQSRDPWEFDLSGTPCEQAIAGQDVLHVEEVQGRFPGFRQLREYDVSGYAGIPLRDSGGRPLGVLAVMTRAPLRRWEQTRDILRLFAVRTAAELGRQRTEQQFHDLFEFSPDAILMVNEGGIITLANRQAVVMFGYTRDELIDLPVDQLVPEAHRSRHAEQRAWFAAAAHARMMGTRPTLFARRKNGTVFPVGIGLSPMTSDFGVQVVAALRDMTEQVQAEERRKVLEAQLRQAQKMEAVGTLASGIAHDFNSILAIALANLELAHRDVEPDHLAAKSLGEIRVVLDRATDLVRQILTFSRGQPSKRTAVSLRGLVQETGRLLRSVLPAAAALEVHLDETPRVLADETQMHQVIMNLGTNAWHALEDRPGAIVLSLDAVTVGSAIGPPSEALAPGRYARISVQDSGKGMDLATRERIFEPFFTTKAAGTGTGLGLAVVHGIVADHGGRIIVETRPGKGSTFRVYLPALEEAVAPAEPTPRTHATARSGHGLNVLCIDDDALLVRATENLLAPLGYRVQTFTRAADALDAIRRDPGQFDIVVSDFNMPEISGLDVAVEVARIRPGLPVVLVSGYLSEHVRQKAAIAGVRQVVPKPYSAATLSEVLLRHARRE